MDFGHGVDPVHSVREEITYIAIFYLIRLELLYSEQKSFLGIDDKITWFKEQAKILKDHIFRTSTAKLLRTNSSDKQIEVLEDYINNL